MNKWFSVVLLSFCMVCFSYAKGNAERCFPANRGGNCCFNVEVGADFLWWKPCIDELDVAAIVTNEDSLTEVDYKGLCLDWEPGFRVYAALSNLFCDWDILANFTYLEVCDTAKQKFTDFDPINGVVSPLIFPTLSLTYEEGRETYELHYQEYNLLASYEICCHCHHFSPYFGVSGIYIEQEIDAFFCRSIIPSGLTSKTVVDGGDTCSVKWTSDYWGVGLRFGSAYEYEFCSGVGMFANGSGVLLAGEACTKNKQIQIANVSLEEEETELRFNDDDPCLFVPGYRIAVGFNYECCLCGTEIGGRVGYEFVEWYNIPNHRVFMGQNSNTQASYSDSPDKRTLGFHGVFAGLYVAF